jgi:hypothetical protein
MILLVLAGVLLVIGFYIRPVLFPAIFLLLCWWFVDTSAMIAKLGFNTAASATGISSSYVLPPRSKREANEAITSSDIAVDRALKVGSWTGYHTYRVTGTVHNPTKWTFAHVLVNCLYQIDETGVRKQVSKVNAVEVPAGGKARFEVSMNGEKMENPNVSRDFSCFVAQVY